MGSTETPAERLEAALELTELAVEMFRDRLRREHPDWSDEALDRRVTEWYHRRPGAEDGDGEGVVVSWPRR